MALPKETEVEVQRIEKIAVLLDSKYTAPFGFRIGWDGILGLIPGFGEFITTLISGYLILRAAMLGVSTNVLLRMGLNVLIDDLIGIIPLFGWIGDFAWKANLKNTKLVREHFTDPARTQKRSTLILVGVAVGVCFSALFFAVLVGVAAWLLIGFLYSTFLAMGSFT
jgi:hypothetical protein